MSERNRKRKIYRRRRLFAVLFMILMAFLIYLVFKSFGSNDEKVVEENNQNIETNETLKVIEATNPVGKSIVKTTNLKEDVVAKKELLPYRQEKMKDNSMGRGAPQHLLKKQVYLTFDDGPSSKVTNEILDILKEEDVKATFFIIGKNAEIYPDVLKRAYDEGHSIGIHTYSHDYKAIYSSPEALGEDINRCLATIRSIVGEDFDTNLYRFPGGSWRNNKEAYVDKVESMGYVYFDWNVLNGDAETGRPSEEYVLKRFNETKRGYNVILSLMHDTDAKTTTASTLPRIIRDLKEDGYEFRTLGDI